MQSDVLDPLRGKGMDISINVLNVACYIDFNKRSIHKIFNEISIDIIAVALIDIKT